MIQSFDPIDRIFVGACLRILARSPQPTTRNAVEALRHLLAGKSYHETLRAMGRIHDEQIGFGPQHLHSNADRVIATIGFPTSGWLRDVRIATSAPTRMSVTVAGRPTWRRTSWPTRGSPPWCIS